MPRRNVVASLLLFTGACGGGTTSTKLSPQPVPPRRLPPREPPTFGKASSSRFPAIRPRSLDPSTDAVGAFPMSMRYAGKRNVQGDDSVMMTVIRFGEGNPAFSPTILVGSPGQQIDLVIENQTPVPRGGLPVLLLQVPPPRPAGGCTRDKQFVNLRLALAPVSRSVSRPLSGALPLPSAGHRTEPPADRNERPRRRRSADSDPAAG
jgi:hypothetical protein